MKKIINGLILVFIILFLSGCTKEYTSIPYNKFLSTFKEKKDYKIIDKTDVDKITFTKSYEAGNGDVSFYYLEFGTQKQAKQYMELSYKNDNFHYSENKDTIVAKRKLSSIYIKAIKVDRTIIIGMSNKFFDRFEVNSNFKDLGM